MEKKPPAARRVKATQAPAQTQEVTEPGKEDVCMIVGIGASAGGLPAMEQFLRNVPAGCGMAFVIVQHLDPTSKGMMAELLQRSTGMAVNEARDGMRVRADEVYVIPPNADLSILHGVLNLLAPAPEKGVRLPIDFFLTSLAQDGGARAIGVILSGMGSDGTAGVRAIKARGGLAAVQDPDTAEFDSMPRSVVDAGLADLSASAEELPEKIMGWLRQKPMFPVLAEPLCEEEAQHEMDKIVVLLRAHTGHDFSYYKRNTLYRRVERRMGLHQIGKMPDYVRYLRENPQELGLLFKELLIGVTSFFRDPDAWKQLRNEVIPALLADRLQGEPVRAWVPGCSTGEEAYALAIVLKEAVEEIQPWRPWTIQVFATDIDQDAIAKARTGLFPASIADDVSGERLKRFFKEVEHGYRVGKEIRELVIFAPQNLIMDPPFTKLDILSCRNLLIYLTPDVQKKLIPLFHYSLRPDGILFQGSAETIGEETDLFAPVGGGKNRLFQKKECFMPPDHIIFPASTIPGPVRRSETRPPQPAATSLQTTADRFVLQRYAPAAVITNEKGDILYVSGRTGKYLEPAAGKANWNVVAMTPEAWRYALTAALQQAPRQKDPVLVEGLKAGPGECGMVEISVQQLDETGPLQGLIMIVFRDAPTAAGAPARTAKMPAFASRLVELEQALAKAHAEARSTHEEMQTSQEELRSTNEELQSTNEELQSSNEELMTSKEEMQSMNEELHAVNAELQAAVDKLSRTSNDMKNLLDSTDIATLFLDRDLNVQRFTPQATKIIKLIPGDTGRPITDLVSHLRDNSLAEDAMEVLRTLVPAEKSVSTDDGRWFTVRIMPYRTFDDRIDGVVITFANITVAKTLETKLREIQSSLEQDVRDQSDELDRRPPMAGS